MTLFIWTRLTVPSWRRMWASKLFVVGGEPCSVFCQEAARPCIESASKMLMWAIGIFAIWKKKKVEILQQQVKRIEKEEKNTT